MSIWTKITKGISSVFSSTGAAVSAGAATVGSKLFTGLNKFWVGVAGSLCAFFGIHVAEGQSSGEALLGWILGTTEGLCFLAILLFVVWMLFFKKKGGSN